MWNAVGTDQSHALGAARAWALMSPRATRHCDGTRQAGEACTPTPAAAETSPTTDAPTAATSSTYSIAIELRIRIQLRISASSTAGGAGDAAQATAPQAEPGQVELSRAERAQLREARHELGHLGKSVRSALREFARENELSPEVRDAIRDIAKQFRRDLRSALRNAAHDGEFDQDAVLSGARDALGDLVSALRALADSLAPAGGDVQPNLPVLPTGDPRAGTAPTSLPQGDGAVELRA